MAEKLKRVTAYLMPDGTSHSNKELAAARWLEAAFRTSPAPISREQAEYFVKARREIVSLLNELDAVESCIDGYGKG